MLRSNRQLWLGREVVVLAGSLFVMHKGFTVLEILIGVAILAFLISVAVGTIDPVAQLGKARDTRRQADLRKLAAALEDYYSDHPCYPEEAVMSSCDPGEGLQPYLLKIPCDPLAGQAYLYDRLADCGQYALYAKMEETGEYFTQTSFGLVEAPPLGP